MKKITTMLLLAILCFSTQNISAEEKVNDENLPTVTMEEFYNSNRTYDLPDKFILQEDSRTRDATGVHSIAVKDGKAQTKKEYNAGLHPKLRKGRRASGYYFSSSSKVNLSVSFGWGPVSIGVDNSSSSGWYIKANSKKYSKVRCYPTLIVQKYIIKTYDNASGRLLYSKKSGSVRVDKEYNKAVYEGSKEYE